MGQRRQNAEFRSNYRGLHVMKRDSDGKLHIACIYYTNPCLQREVFAGSPRCRVSASPESPELPTGVPRVALVLPGVMEPSQ